MKGQYRVAGLAISYALLHYGLRPNFLAAQMLEVLQNKSTTNVQCTTENINDFEEREKIEQVKFL